jgi:diadenosine tetraphosphatase ApaH/serine/threonine PP2A family protein phosphatase
MGPTPDFHAEARAAHLADIGQLPDDDLLALAYTFSHNEARLRVYLEVFRGRTGSRAQFAACLICFDLAQRGDAAMGAQFGYLRGTLEALSADEALVGQLVGTHSYLCDLWARCASALRHAPSAAGHDAPGSAELLGYLRAQDAPLAGAIDLLTDDDLDPQALEVDREAMWQNYVRGCEEFFGSGINQAIYDSSMGFHLRGHHGQARAQAFDHVLEHCQEFVAPAKGMRPLLLLCWGLSLKPRGLLGQANRRRQHLLQAGIEAFIDAGEATRDVAAVLSPLYAEPDAWRQISQLLGQYQQYAALQPKANMPKHQHVEAFVAALPQ